MAYIEPIDGCEELCEDVLFDVTFDEDCPTGLTSGRVTWMVVLDDTDDFPADPETASEWDSITNKAILRGLGTIPEASDENVELYSDPEYSIRATRQATFDVTDLNDTNYTTLQSWQCGIRKRVILGTDDMFYDFGVSSIKVNSSAGGGANDMFTANLTITRVGRTNVKVLPRFKNPFV